jgi:hypothetical protein
MKIDLRKVTKLPGTTIVQNKGVHHRRVLIGVPTLGIIRIEWDVHRRGQAIPINWQSGEVTASHQPKSVVSLGYSVADAQNVIVERAFLDKYEWLLLWEDDVLPPFNALLMLDKHMNNQTAPIISGLYYSKGNPSWPLVFRGRGNGAFRDFKMGDRVWCDGVPTGFFLCHMSIINYLWAHSPEYKLPDGRKVREIFKFPRESWYDPEQDRYFAQMGTSDLFLCDRIIKEKILEKTGWKKFGNLQYPFLIDTKIFCQQIDLNGIYYPAQAEEILLPLGELQKIKKKK